MDEASLVAIQAPLALTGGRSGSSSTVAEAATTKLRFTLVFLL